MTGIEKLKTLLEFAIKDRRYNLPVGIGGDNNCPKNAILLFLNNDNANLSIGKTVRDGYYSIGIDVVIIHQDYDRARQIAFEAIEYISVNRKAYANFYFIPDNDPPIYTGKDERTGGYTFIFSVKSKSGEY